MCEIGEVQLGLLRAKQFVDQLSALMRVPYRPVWLQPIQEAQECVSQVMSENARLKRDNEAMREHILELEEKDSAK